MTVYHYISVYAPGASIVGRSGFFLSGRTFSATSAKSVQFGEGYEKIYQQLKLSVSERQPEVNTLLPVQLFMKNILLSITIS
jgi:hypothetical protein